ncbi:MAG: enoyl-CoA hydratase/isomerase family protein, partial [Pseudomonadota bacterium]
MSEILYDVREGIAYITLNRPEARNALTFGMYEEIARLCADVKLGGEIKSVVISGAGDKAFAAG